VSGARICKFPYGGGSGISEKAPFLFLAGLPESPQFFREMGIVVCFLLKPNTEHCNPVFQKLFFKP
jgi:hypothetical protein